MASGTQEAAAVVGIWDLQVVIAPAGESWMAQAVQIDYAACGDSEEDVKRRFEDGLTATIQEHFNLFGNVDRLLSRSAPTQDWIELANKRKGKNMAYTHTSAHLFEKKAWADVFPFERITYATAEVA